MNSPFHNTMLGEFHFRALPYELSSKLCHAQPPRTHTLHVYVLRQRALLSAQLFMMA